MMFRTVLAIELEDRNAFARRGNSHIQVYWWHFLKIANMKLESPMCVARFILCVEPKNSAYVTLFLQVQ